MKMIREDLGHLITIFFSFVGLEFKMKKLQVGVFKTISEFIKVVRAIPK